MPRRCCTCRSALGLAALVLLGAATSDASAQSLGPRLEGLGPDLQVSGGAGIGLEESLSNPFLGRVRLGLLYAHEPWIVDFGASLEAGALAGLGFGASAGLSRFDGWYSEIGVVRAQGAGWVTHLCAGFTLFGFEWQHRFDTRSEDALLVQLRVPLGLWWFVDRERERQQQTRKATTGTRATWHARLEPDAVGEAAVEPERPATTAAPAVVAPAGHVRVLVDGATYGLVAAIDGEVAPSALLGYDVELSPGEHELSLRRQSGEVVTQRFIVEPGKLVRVSVTVPPRPITGP